MEEEPLPLVPFNVPLQGADPALLEVLLQARLSLFWGVHTPTRALLAMLTLLAARGRRVRVFDGGNRFDGYFVARLARRLCRRGGEAAYHPRTLLDRVRLSRAFTCFQLAELIENALPGPEPLFVLDLLTTFYDESVPLRDTERLLADTLAHLRRLAAAGPVIVGAREPQVLVKERWGLLDQLQVAADAAWMLRAPQETPLEQARLF